MKNIIESYYIMPISKFGVNTKLGNQKYNYERQYIFTGGISNRQNKAIDNKIKARSYCPSSTKEISIYQFTLPGPPITITGSNPMNVEKGTTYTEQGATTTATDLSGTITASGTVDTTTVGSYTITYTAQDLSGNTSTANRTVNVVDTTGPIITITGNNPMNVNIGGTYTEEGATVSSDATGPVVITGSVDTSTLGSYTITYTAQDVLGNTTIETRIVNVEILFVQLGSDIDGESFNDRSGTSVAMSSNGTRIAIGAPRDGDNGVDSGHVRVYDWNGTSWLQIGGDIDGETRSDESGYSLAMSSDGTRIAIGAPRNDGTTGGLYDEYGHVRVYDWDGSSWNQVGGDIDGESNNDFFGFSLAMSSDGTRIAIGSDTLMSNDKKVSVYDWNGSSWNQVGSNIQNINAYDGFGREVAISSDGSIIAVTDYSTSSGGSGTFNYNGMTSVYQLDSNAQWVQLGSDIMGQLKEQFGRSVAMSSNGLMIAVGGDAPSYDGSTGSDDKGLVRVYEYSASGWAQLGGDIIGEAANDESGFSVAMSSNGTRIAIGARYNDGENSDNSGHVRIYDWNGSSWVKITSDIDGEVLRDYSGSSLAMSSDGTTIAIGAPQNDGNGSGSGHVRVYKQVQ